VRQLPLSSSDKAEKQVSPKTVLPPQLVIQMATLNLQTQNYHLALMQPNMITDAWISWANNGPIMRQVNAKTRKANRADIVDYVLDAMAKQRAILGIFSKSNAAQIGIVEVLFDQNHRNMNLDILIDFKTFNSKSVLDEILPALLGELKARFGAEKAVVVLPETYLALTSYFEESTWRKEGTLRSELPHATENRRINAVQFGLSL
jgi:hypothetical protein